jgi:hypothetical protein
MTNTRRIFLLLLLALCLLADAWALTRFVASRPARAVVVDAKPGEAVVRFEKMPIGAADGCVLGVIVLTNVLASMYAVKSWPTRRKKGV